MRRTGALLMALMVSVFTANAQQQTAHTGEQTVAQDLKRMTIEELSQLDITSVSRRPEKLADTAAAVSVIRGAF